MALIDKDTFQKELNEVRSQVPGLPNHPFRAVQAINEGIGADRELRQAVSSQIDGLSASLGKRITISNYDDPEVQKLIAHNDAMKNAMAISRNKGAIGMSKSGSTRRAGQDDRWNQGFIPRVSMAGMGGNALGGDVYNAIPRFYDPLEYWDLSGLPWNVADEGHRHKLHKWLRLYYATHYLVPVLIDIFTRFPLVGMNLECSDQALVPIYEDIFFEQLDYEEFLVALGREFWLTGDAFPLGSFDEDLGVWEHEELINPEDVVIDNFPLLNTQQLKIVPPDYLRRIAQNRSPAREWYMLQQNYEDLIPYLLKGEHIPISPVMLTQVANKLNHWDDHGTPILLRGLRTLLHEEKLLASQDAIAERLYSPFILAKLGIMDMGDGLPPWIPTPDELQSVRDDIDIAMAADFRVMVHHFGLDMTSVFGREQMPRLGDDFDRIERRLMECLAGNTLVHTIRGLERIQDLVGQNIQVLSDGGIYREAKFEYYGEREIYQLVLDNGDILEATENHQWIVNTSNGRKKRFTTKDMEGRRIPQQYLQDDFVYDENEWLEGAQHGLVYGYCEWKSLPSIDQSPSYLRGFIAGFIAADGNIDDTGYVKLLQSDKNCLQQVRRLAIKAQLPTVSVRETTDNSRFPEESESYELGFVKAGFWLSDNKGFDPHLILSKLHKELAAQCHMGRQRYSARVIAVIPTGRIEPVYCCVEPHTHSFVIDNMYLTGNCFGVNPSLLSAGSNSQPYASSALQAEFMNQMLRTFQKQLKNHYKFRAAVVAEAQGHYAYTKKGSTRVPIYENVVTYDEDGNKIITKEHKLLYPDLDFSVLDLRDEATERQFLMGLRAAGVPIPDDKLMIGISWKDQDYIGQYDQETMKKTIAQQRAKMDTYIALVIQGLPVPMDLKYEVESVLQGGTGPAMGGMPGAPGGPGAGQEGSVPPPGGPGGAPAGPEGGLGAQMPPPPPGLGAGAGTAPPGGGPPAMTPMQPGAPGSVPQVSNERRPGLTYNKVPSFTSSVQELDISEWPEEMQTRAATIQKSIDKYGWFLPEKEQEETKEAAIIDEDEDANNPQTWILASNQKIAQHNGEHVILESGKKRINLPIESGKKYSLIDPLAEESNESTEPESS